MRTTGPRGRDADPAASAAADLAAPRVSKIPTGRSMSALLQSRSEAAAAITESKQQQQPQSPMPDIDSEDKGNELAAVDYVADIFSYYKRVEPQFRVSPTYMSRQVSDNNARKIDTRNMCCVLPFCRAQSARMHVPTACAHQEPSVPALF